MYEITCSGCGTVLSVDERHFGRIGKCRKCGQRIRIRAPQDDVPKPRSPRRTQLPQVVFHENKAQPCHTRDDGSQTDQSNSTPPQSTVRPASKAQKEFARDLGVNFEENITNRELSALIDSALPTFLDSSPVEMVNQLEKRGLRAMLITWPKPEVAADPCNAALELISSKSMSLNDVHFMLAAVVSNALAGEELTFPEYARRYAEIQKKLAAAHDATEDKHETAADDAKAVSARIFSAA